MIDTWIGYIISANHRVVDEATYPYYLGNVWLNGNRARRIKRLIEEHVANDRKYTMQDAQKMMMDLKSMAVADLQEALSRVESVICLRGNIIFF